MSSDLASAMTNAMEKIQEVDSKLDLVVKYLKQLLKDNPNFYGKVVLNFHNGVLAHLNREESVKLE